MTAVILLHKILRIILYVSIVVELCVFPSWENVSGCVMTFFCWLIFDTYFLKSAVICKYPFAFLMFMSMFFYRFLPLPATLLEGKPITYGLQLPFHTFFFETLLFIVSALAFKASFTKGRHDNLLQCLLKKGYFYESYPISVVWAIGLVGLLARLYTFSMGDIQYGNVLGKLLSGLTFLMYAPIVLFFPRLYGNRNLQVNGAMKTVLIGYVVMTILLGVASNSREGLIAPFALLVLLYFLQVCNRKEPLVKYLSPVKIVVGGMVIYLLLGLLADLSTAMLYNRFFRSQVTKRELLAKTIDTYEDKDLIVSLRRLAEQEQSKKLAKYDEGWTESYVNNFMLNRYCNIRITDQTLYYAFRLSQEDKKKMRTHFYNRAILSFPTPVLDFMGIHLDKNDFDYSRGDLLYALARNESIFPGYRVTSHLGDGLATFGYFYFAIQFILSFLVFKLLNTLVYYFSSSNVYSLSGLISLFTFWGMFRNANGCIDDLGYILRGYWQNVILWCLLSMLFQWLLAFKQLFVNDRKDYF